MGIVCGVRRVPSLPSVVSVDSHWRAFCRVLCCLGSISPTPLYPHYPLTRKYFTQLSNPSHANHRHRHPRKKRNNRVSAKRVLKTQFCFRFVASTAGQSFVLAPSSTHQFSLFTFFRLTIIQPLKRLELRFYSNRLVLIITVGWWR